MRAELFQPSEEGEARLLILISTFTGKSRSLEGRTKLAKLDFLLRYPRFLRRGLTIRGAAEEVVADIPDREDVDSRMVRYRYGPWDPAYYALLGRLVGKRLVEPTPFERGIGYRATEEGQAVAKRLQYTEDWAIVGRRARLLKKHLDLSGANLTRFVYENFPEVAQASWGDRL
jgi:hypothetical protein